MWTKDYVNYVGMAVLGSEFKFSPTSGWNGGDFGSADGLEFTTNDGGELIGTGLQEARMSMLPSQLSTTLLSIM